MVCLSQNHRTRSGYAIEVRNYGFHSRKLGEKKTPWKTECYSVILNAADDYTIGL